MGRGSVVSTKAAALMSAVLASSFVVVVAATAATIRSTVAAAADNMNGPYVLSPTPGAPDTSRLFPRRYSDYPDPPGGGGEGVRGVTGSISSGKTEHFDVYSPEFSTLYSQVFWKALPPVPLPAEVVEKFRGKGMAVVGFEVDQVRSDDGGNERSVPINAAYNHHFETTMIGEGAAFVEAPAGGAARADEREESDAGMTTRRGRGRGHGSLADDGQPHYAVLLDGPTSSGLPPKQDFGGANGGEYRGTFHGYAPGHAQVLYSPTEFQVTPMQIDTWNRDGMDLDGKDGGRFVAGPLPRSSLAPADAEYSGLLECPVTTRIRRDVRRDFEMRMRGACSDGGGGAGGGSRTIESAEECFDAAGAVLSTFGGAFERREGSGGGGGGEDASGRPAGCSATSSADGGTVHVYYNNGTASAECGAEAEGTRRRAGSASSLVNVTLHLDPAHDVATITLSGPAGTWFGVGFGASAMRDRPWAVIVDGEGAVTERQLGDQNPGEELSPSVEVMSSTVGGGVRTVTVRRSLQGKTEDYYTFDATGGTTSIPFINAIGSTAELSYHKARGPSSLSVLPVAGPGVAGACLCASAPPPFGSAVGSLEYVPTSQRGESGANSRVSFWNRCSPRPRSDLLEMRNPACDVRYYSGGQLACHHMWSLLDADQPIPWPDRPLSYRLKFRFWVQEYDPSYHRQVKRTTWGIASPVEYDVPECREGVEGCERRRESEEEEDEEGGGGGGRWVHTIRGTFEPTPKVADMRLVAAHFHCHAPTCLSVELYLCEKGGVAYGNGNATCDADSGRLLCRQEPVYGGTSGGERTEGAKDDADGRFDEPGYMRAQPPCLWGSSEFGLEEPVDVSGGVLHAVKTADATVGHHGEMAWLQMYYV